MKTRFFTTKMAALICSLTVHAQSSRVIFLTKYPQRVPSGKVWYINNTQSFSVTFTKGAQTSGTACRAAFYSNPRFTSGISYISSESVATNYLLFTFKEAKTMDNIVFNIQPVFFLNDAEKIPQTLTWKFRPTEIKFYPGTSIWLVQCINNMTIYERDMKPGEKPVSPANNLDSSETFSTIESSSKPEFNTILQAKSFSEGLAQVSFDNSDNAQPLYGYLNVKGALVIQPQFIEANDFQNGFALVSKTRGSYMLIDKSGKSLLTEPLMFAKSFCDGFAAIRPFTTGGWNFVNTKGMTLSHSYYDEVRDFHEGLAAVKTQDGWGFIDTTGKEVIVPQFDKVGDFSEGIALTAKHLNAYSTEYKYIDATGNVTLQLRLGDSPIQCYDRNENTVSFSDFHNGHILVNVNRTMGNFGYLGVAILDKQGKIIIKDKGNIYPENDGLYLAKYLGYYGYVNLKGKWEIPNKFDEAHSFSEGLAVVKIHGNYGYIDKTGQVVINQDILKSKSNVLTNPIFEYASDFSEGLAVVETRGKYGYIDHSGNWVVQPTLLKASSFHEGIAAVKFPNKNGWSYIDKQGNVLFEKIQ